MAITDERREQARELFHAACQAQMQGRFEQAVELYRGSIAAYPTAEAYTFLGWTYHFQGKLEQAIEECKNAITIDPTFGNPYNDIGSYLIEQQKFDDAIPWLERAIRSSRYEAYHFPGTTWDTRPRSQGNVHAGPAVLSQGARD